MRGDVEPQAARKRCVRLAEWGLFGSRDDRPADAANRSLSHYGQLRDVRQRCCAEWRTEKPLTSVRFSPLNTPGGLSDRPLSAFSQPSAAIAERLGGCRIERLGGHSSPNDGIGRATVSPYGLAKAEQPGESFAAERRRGASSRGVPLSRDCALRRRPKDHSRAIAAATSFSPSPELSSCGPVESGPAAPAAFPAATSVCVRSSAACVPCLRTPAVPLCGV